MKPPENTELSPIVKADTGMRDIILPDPVAWWPLAPGWWVLLALLLLSALLFWLLKRQKINEAPPSLLVSVHKEALDELKQVYRIADDVEFVQALSSLLKRVAITKYGKSISGLTGRRWLKFLDSKWHSNDFTQGKGSVLSDLAYRPEPNIDRKEIIALIKAWMDYQLQPKEVTDV